MKIFLKTFLFLFLFLLFPTLVFAQTTQNNLNILDSTVIEQPTDMPVSKDIKIQRNISFSFSISETLIDFGPLSPTDPVLRTNTLSVSNTATAGYTVTAYENNPLKESTSSATIPDTTCDNGACNSTDGGTWEGTLTYGFGYRCDSSDKTKTCLPGFSDFNSYKQFAKETTQPQNIMESASGESSIAQITYKVNISGSQQSGFYNNTLTFIAVPNF